MFRMHEHVRAADPATIAAWLEVWLARAMSFTGSLGLEARCAVHPIRSSGAAASCSPTAQRDQRLKLEIVATVANDE